MKRTRRSHGVILTLALLLGSTPALAARERTGPEEAPWRFPQNLWHALVGLVPAFAKTGGGMDPGGTPTTDTGGGMDPGGSPGSGQEPASSAEPSS